MSGAGLCRRDDAATALWVSGAAKSDSIQRVLLYMPSVEMHPDILELPETGSCNKRPQRSMTPGAL